VALVLASTFVLAYSAEASATTYCVDKPACVSAGGTEEPTFQGALNVADAHPGRDRVELGPGDFNSGGAAYVANASNDVDIVGSGTGTILRNSAASAVTVQEPSATISQLTIKLQTSNTTALRLYGSAEHIFVDGDSGRSTAGTGIELRAGTSLRVSKVNLPTGEAPFTTGVVRGNDAGERTAEDVEVTADAGFDTGAVGGAASLTLRRVLVRGRFPIGMVSGTVNVEDAVIELGGTGIMYGLSVSPDRAGSATGTMNASHVTVIGPGVATPNAYGLRLGADTDPGGATLNLRNSIVRGVQHTASREGNGAVPANLTIAYSDYDPATIAQSGTGAATEGPGNVDLDPAFVNAGVANYHLTAASPLLDAGDPAAGGFASDLDGLPRVTDANGDCLARRDMGAYEFQPAPRAPHASAAVSPASVAAGTPASFNSAGSCDPDGDTLTYAWSFDDGSTGSGQPVQHAFATIGTHTATVTVSDGTGRSATAVASLIVTPRPGTCVNPFTGTAAANTINGSASGDTINGLSGNDKLYGLAGNDCINGGKGNDKLSGGAGNDKLDGGKGDDKLSGGSGKNAYKGGSGNDAINAKNGKKEKVDCGSGSHDRATVDHADKVKGCERVKRAAS
jgi:PKD repeat protein